MILQSIFNALPRIRRLIIPLALAGLVGCAGQPPREPAQPQVTRLPAAEARVAAGDLAAAADLYLQAAETAPAQAAFDYRIQAADLLIRSQSLEQASLVLDGVAAQSLTGDQQFALRLRQAQLALARNQPDLALERLGAAPTDTLPVAQQVDFHRLRAEAYDMQGNHLENARERIWLDGLLADPAERQANHDAIVQALSYLTTQALIELRPDIDNTLSGWMDLVRISRQYRHDPEALQQALGQWRERFPDHPAQAATLDRLVEQTQRMGQFPQQVGVLLPLSGRLASAGEAIRNGLLTAYYQMDLNQPRPVLRFYDVGDSPDRSWSLYQQAIHEGAEFVIGPLDKASVAELARAGRLDVPVLALNWAPTDEGETPLPDMLFQFSLAPEDEARQVAERAFHSGKSRALALIPEGTWGERVFSAFLERWEELGGDLLEVQYYGTKARGFSDQVKVLVNLDSSYSRRTQLVRILGRQVEFEARRRQDADFVFMLAQPQPARLLRPLFRFHHAGDLPIYATSHIFTGNADSNRDRDMDGIMFCDIPWLLDAEEYGQLRQQVSTLWPESAQRFPRLYAFGYDALHLLPYLSMPQLGHVGIFSGATGILSLDDVGRLHRHLRWARMQKGLPVAMPALPRDVARQQTGAPLNDGQSLTDESDDQTTGPHPGAWTGGGGLRAPLPETTGADPGQPQL